MTASPSTSLAELFDKPFLIYREPGSKTLVKCPFSSMDTDSTLHFGNVKVEAWKIGNNSCLSTPRTQSTPKDAYLQGILSLKESLEKSGDKAVVCRNICGRFKTKDFDNLVESYFARFPSMFCFLFYHPATGAWMGASPELLLESDSSTQAHTRALAGTMSASGKTWSAKNKDEHAIVVEDILQRINHLSANIEVSTQETSNFVYGDIQHLCTPIDLRSDTALDFHAITDAIHPTAAVGGYPLASVEQRLRMTEDFPRQYYGGLISVTKDSGFTAYVVLRCVHFNETHWCVYTGSGITSASDALDEWIETENKAKPLIDILSSH